MNRHLSSLATGALVLLLAGCSTYTQTNQEAATARRSGNAVDAAAKAARHAEKHPNDKDTVVFALEAGAAYRTLGLAQVPPTAPASPATGAAEAPIAPGAVEADRLLPYHDSIRYFARADEKIDAYEEQARISVSSGVVKAITNPASAPYRGQTYDKVMASTYQALNYLAVGEPEKARASFNKAYRRQEDAVAENASRIEKDQAKIAAAREGKTADEEGKEAGQGVDLERSQQDPKSQAAMEQLAASLDERIRAYGDYVNPFTVFADALFMMSCSTDRQEQERAAKQFVRVASMAGDNPYLKEDAVLAEQLAAGQAALPRLTYVIFESGEAAHREEMIIPIPLFLFTNETLYTQLPLYRLQYNDQFSQSATVLAGAHQLSTAEICNMDSVIARDFKNGMTSMYVDAFLCASTKALIQHALNKEAKKQGGSAGLAMMITGLVVNATTTRADTRSWQSLPKTFSYARVPTPEDGMVTVTTADGMSKVVKVPEGTVSVVYAKQVQPGTPLLVDAFRLN